MQTMTTDGPDTAGLASPPDPQPDRGKPVPARLAEVHAVRVILAKYGDHLYQTLQHRAVARGFASIAQFFGTAQVATILAHLYRGLMRCHALDRMLRARAALGFDLTIRAPRAPARRTVGEDASAANQAGAPPPPAPLTPEAEAKARAAAAARAEARLARRLAAGQPLSFDTMPGQEQIEAEVRHSPIGRTLVLICRDFGISPGLCEGAFWNRLYDAIRCYGGSLGQMMQEMRRREREFDKRELDRNPNLGWPEQTREGLRRVLGFCIGEPPVDPFAPAPGPAPAACMAVATPGVPGAAAATRPP